MLVQDLSVLDLANNFQSTVLSLCFPLPLENKTVHTDTFVIRDKRRNKTFDARGTTQIKNKTNTNNLN